MRSTWRQNLPEQAMIRENSANPANKSRLKPGLPACAARLLYSGIGSRGARPSKVGSHWRRRDTLTVNFIGGKCRSGKLNRSATRQHGHLLSRRWRRYQCMIQPWELRSCAIDRERDGRLPLTCLRLTWRNDAPGHPYTDRRQSRKQSGRPGVETVRRLFDDSTAHIIVRSCVIGRSDLIDGYT